MVEISAGWPRKNVNVWLKNPITDRYVVSHPKLDYRYFGDPKTWLEEYVDAENEGMIAVKFSSHFTTPTRTI